MSVIFPGIRLMGSRARLQRLINITERLDKRLDQELKQFNLRKQLVEEQTIDDQVSLALVLDDLSNKLERINEVKQSFVVVLRLINNE